MALLPDAGLNQAPVVSGLTDVTVPLDQSVELAADIADDKLPYDRLDFAWSKVSGPGNVTFSTTSRRKTRASFSAAGTYRLRLTVRDGQLATQANVAVTVTTVPLGPSVLAGKLPTVSSTYFNDWQPRWVTDGAFSTDYKSGIWLSAEQDNPWVQVDAGRAVIPRRFVVGARAGNADERSGFEVRASNTASFANYVVLASQGEDAFGDAERWTANVYSTNSWRYFRVQGRNRYLSTSEFQVFEAAAAPAITPPGGNYSLPTTVTLASGTDGASIRYTLDGSVPTATTGALYDDTPIMISSTGTLRAVAFRNGMATSVVTEARYQILALELVGLEVEGDDLRVFWRTAGGTRNQLQVTESLAFSFENLGPELLVQGTGATVTNYLDLGGATRGAVRLFRVRAVP